MSYTILERKINMDTNDDISKTCDSCFHLRQNPVTGIFECEYPMSIYQNCLKCNRYHYEKEKEKKNGISE